MADLSIDELMQVEVTSVSKKEQRLSQATAAIYVITQEDIRRWNALRGGFRVDWDLSKQDAVTFQGDLYRKTAGVTSSRPSLAPPFTMVFDDESHSAGGNLLGRWKHVSSERSETEVRRYSDARLGWAPVQGLDLSLGLQNLLDPRHVEYDGAVDVVTRNQISRSIYGKITWRF